MTNIINRNLGIFLVLISSATQAQDWYGWIMPRESQQASVTQRIGVTDITVSYHRPDVKGRKLWGDLIPYHTVWRAGANNATTVTFSTNILIEGKELKAGSYSYFLIPTEKDWTVVLNKNASQWGAYTYQEDLDALRVNVKPLQGEFTESLQFAFPTVTDSSSVLVMSWGSVKIPINISVTLRTLVHEKVSKQVNWQAALFAMEYYHDVLNDLDESLKWANVSLALKENHIAIAHKAKIFNAKGDYKKSLELAKKALEVMKRDMPKMSTKRLDDLIAELKTK